MNIDFSTEEGRKLAIIYEMVKNNMPNDYEPYDSKKDVYCDGPVPGYTPEDAYEEGMLQICWDIMKLIEAGEVRK